MSRKRNKSRKKIAEDVARRLNPLAPYTAEDLAITTEEFRTRFITPAVKILADAVEDRDHANGKKKRR